MTNMFIRFWEWLMDSEPANFGEWRDRVETVLKSKAGMTAYTSVPAAAGNPLPLGSRFRPPATEFSMTMGQLEELNRLLKNIRPLPQGAMKVMRELDTADSSAASVAEAIECEPVMAAGMIRIANSTAMGLRREITSVSDAVAYLGFSTTKSLLLKFNVSDLLPSSRPGQGYDSGKLWVHAMAVAQVAEEIARRRSHGPKSGADGRALARYWKAGDQQQVSRRSGRTLVPGCRSQRGPSQSRTPAFPGGSRDHRRHVGERMEIAARPDRDHPAASHARWPSRASAGNPAVLFSIHIANQLVKYRHVYCDGMEIDEVPASMTSELGLPDWSRLLADVSLRSIIDRAVLLNGGATDPAAAAA